MTTLFSTCVDIAEKVIKQQTIAAASLPILATLLDSANTNITNTLFGISSLSLDASYWTVTSTTLTNTLDINFGFALTDYALPLKLRLTTSDGIIVATSVLDAVIETGSELILYSGTGVILTLDFGTVKLSNAILNLLFKGVNTFPSALSVKYYDNSNALQATITLAPNKWSKREIGTLGEIYFEYGDTQMLPSINSIIDLTRITDASNNIWFECPIALPTNLKPSSIIYSNSLVLRILNIEVDLNTYISPTNPDSIFWVSFNGNTKNCSSNSPITSLSGIDYNSEIKLFGTETLICSSTTNIQYSDVTFPDQFTLDCFFYFTTATAGRLINFVEKSGVFNLSKTVGNNLEVSINGSVILSTSWTPVLGVWNHIRTQKTATELRLRVNASDINISTSYTTTPDTNSNPLSICTNILGLCNGVYIESGSPSTFTPFTQPLPKRVNDWSDISFFTWLNLEFPQLKKFF
ncbi:hypothetical protein Pam2_84 [Pseudanabaena phage Pam2]|nr:hypothetical protein Pam2_84 [Pseudanabaena phage Pam2]